LPEQRSSRILYLEPLAGDPPQSAAGEKDLVDYIQLAKSRIVMLSFWFCFGLACAAAFSYLTAPTYLSRVTLEIQSTRESMEGLRGLESSGFTPEAYVQTQLRILQSRMLRERVVQALSEQFPNRRFVQDSPTYKMKKLLRLAVSQPVATTLQPQVETRARVLDTSRILEITGEASDAAFVADYLNTMAGEYMENNMEASLEAGRRTNQWLNRQLEEARLRLQQSETQLHAFSQDLGILTSGPGSVREEKLRQLQTELLRAEADRIAKQSEHEMLSSAKADSIPKVIDNERLSGYRVKLAELRRELAELNSLYTPEHYRVQRVNAQIKEVETTLTQERDSILARIHNDYMASLRRESLLVAAYGNQLAEVAAQMGKSVNYEIVKREVETNRTLYNQLLQRAGELSITSALSASNVRILDKATAPVRPYRPDWVRNLALGAFTGLLFGFGLIVVGEFLNRSFRAPGEVSYFLRVPELGAIPLQRSSVNPVRAATPPLLLPQIEDGSDSKLAVELVTWHDQPSPMAESFRSVITSILTASQSTDGKQILMITSAARGEGKTTTVSNLGIALAEIGQRVLLIDADIRKPRLHQIFNLPNTWGLSSLLRESTPLENCPLEALARQSNVVEGLSILTSGPGTANIANLLCSTRMKLLLKRVRGEFDTVLMDAPPTSYLADARLLGRVAEGVILVVRAGLTTRDTVLNVKQRLLDDGIPILGTILNGWDLRSKARYGYGLYEYSSHS